MQATRSTAIRRGALLVCIRVVVPDLDVGLEYVVYVGVGALTLLALGTQPRFVHEPNYPDTTECRGRIHAHVHIYASLEPRTSNRGRARLL